MSRFYKTNVAGRKTVLQGLDASASVGIAFGWIEQIKGALEIESSAAHIDPALMTDDHPETDLRLIVRAVSINARIWRQQNSVSHPSLTGEEIDLCKTSIDLFCKWKVRTNGANPPVLLTFGIPELTVMYTKVGQALSAVNLQAMSTFIQQGVRSIITDHVVGPPVVNASWAPNAAHTAADYGFLLPIWAAGTTEFLIHQQLTAGTIPGTAPPVATVYAPGLLNATLLNNIPTLPNSTRSTVLGILWIWKQLLETPQKLREDYGQALVLFVLGFMKEQPSRDWIKTRSDRIAQAMDLTPGSLAFSEKLTPYYRNLARIEQVDRGMLIDCLRYMGLVSHSLGLDPINWMIDQAQYSGMTVAVTFIECLSTYPDMPYGLLFTGCTQELLNLLSACMYGYLFPFSGMISIKFPASKFPSLAQAAITIALAIGKTTYKQYGGKFTGANTDTVDRITSGFEAMRQALVNVDAVAAYLVQVINIKPVLRINRGIVSFDFGVQTANPPAVGAALTWPADFKALLREVPADWSYAICDVNALYAYLRQHQLGNPNTANEIKILYSSVAPLNTAFQSSVFDQQYSAASAVRAVPAANEALGPLAGLTGATNMTW